MWRKTLAQRWANCCCRRYAFGRFSAIGFRTLAEPPATGRFSLVDLNFELVSGFELRASSLTMSGTQDFGGGSPPTDAVRKKEFPPLIQSVPLIGIPSSSIGGPFRIRGIGGGDLFRGCDRQE